MVNSFDVIGWMYLGRPASWYVCKIVPLCICIYFVHRALRNQPAWRHFRIRPTSTRLNEAKNCGVGSLRGEALRHLENTASLKWLRVQNTRPLLWNRFNSTESDRWLETSSRNLHGSWCRAKIQAGMSLNFCLGNTKSSGSGWNLLPRNCSQRKFEVCANSAPFYQNIRIAYFVAYHYYYCFQVSSINRVLRNGSLDESPEVTPRRRHQIHDPG